MKTPRMPGLPRMSPVRTWHARVEPGRRLQPIALGARPLGHRIGAQPQATIRDPVVVYPTMNPIHGAREISPAIT